MSETPPEPGPREAERAPREREPREAREARGGSGLSRKWHGVPIWAWTVGGTVAAVVLWKWWKDRGGNPASMSSNAGSNTASCYDISGQLVPCQEAAANNASDYGMGQGGLDGTLNGMFPTSATGTGTGSQTPCQAATYPAPSGLAGKAEGPTTLSVTWDTLGGQCPPNSYTVAVYQLNGKRVSYGTTSCPDTTGGKCSATVNGLHPNWSYNVRVWANGAKVGPPSAQTRVKLPAH